MRISDWSSDVCSSDLGPYSAVLDVVKQYGEKLAGKVLVDITNPVAPDLTSFVTPGDSFGAQEIAKAAPANAVIVKAFNTLFSHVLAAGSLQGRPLDVFIAGDDAQAKARVEAFIERLGRSEERRVGKECVST